MPRRPSPSLPVPPRALAAIRRRQLASVGYLLIRAGQLWNERAIGRVNAEAGAPVLRAAHTALLPHLLHADGIRVTTLARRLGVTKQAVHQLVAEMARTGVVRVAADPRDRRARRVHLTAHGVAAMDHGTGVLEAIEAELAAELGARTVAGLRRGLRALHDRLGGAADVATDDEAPTTRSGRARRRAL